MMGRMARIQKREDVVELSTRDRMHVEINNIVVVCLYYVELFNISHDLRTKYNTICTAKNDLVTCKMTAKKLKQ
jgi:hypothetical protein